MPYSGINDDSLPDNVKKMSDSDREKWVAIFNKAFEACEAGGEGDCESEAFQAANGALKRLGGKLAVKRTVVEVESWDGSASGYEDTNAYCSACLIDVNSAAGRDEKAQSHCKLPVKAPGSSSYADKGIKAAAGAMAGARGGLSKPSDVSEDDWQAALKKAASTIISAYNEMGDKAPDSIYEIAGKSPPEKRTGGKLTVKSFAEWLRKIMGKERVVSLDQVYASSNEIYSEHGGAMIHDLYFDAGSTFFVVSEKGRIYRVPVSFPGGGAIEYGEWEPVEIAFTPTQEPENRLRIFRQADGKVRWVAISASAVLNRDAEIDSTALFDDMVSRAEKTGNYPYRTIYHLGEPFRIGQADMLARDGFLYITSGIFDDSELARAMVRDIEANPGKWGDSIGYIPADSPEMWPVTEGVTIPVYRSGTNVEISSVLSQHACNYFTVINVEGVNRMNEVAKKALEDLLGKERATEFISLADKSNEQITADGMITRTDGVTANGGNSDKPGETTPTSDKVSAERVVDLGDEQNRRSIAKAIQDTPEFKDFVQTLIIRMETTATDLTALQTRAGEINARLDDLTARVLKIEQGARETEVAMSDMSRMTLRVQAPTYRPSVPQSNPDGAGDNGADVAFAEVAQTVLSGLPKY